MKSSATTPDRLMQMAWGYAPPLIVEAGIRHGIFDHLNGGSLTVEQLAQKTGSSTRGLKAILDALVGLELLARNGPGYTLTAESAAFLISTKPGYQGGFFRHISQDLIPRWLTLNDAVHTGQPATKLNNKTDGPGFFADFVESLFPLSYVAAQKLGEHLGIPQATQPVSVLDIGAGSGVWGIALAQQSRQVRIRAVDWPQVLAVTQKIARRFQLEDRLTTVAGDLLEADFGQGNQVATIGHILHSEGPERSQRLLQRTFNALAPGGTVAIMEFMVNEDRTGPPVGLIFAVNMLVNTEAGDTFSFSEMSAWLQQAGFINPRLLEVPAVSPLILATRP